MKPKTALPVVATGGWLEKKSSESCVKIPKLTEQINMLPLHLHFLFTVTHISN